MTTKERLHSLVEQLSDAEVNKLPEYADWLAQESDTLTTDELERVREGQAAIESGDYVTLEALWKRIDP